LATRRVGSFSVAGGDWNEILPESSKEFDEEVFFDTTEVQFGMPQNPAKGLPHGDRHTIAIKHKARRVFRNGVPIEAIALSSCSEDMYREIDFGNDDFKSRFRICRDSSGDIT
jgi:hypothetical protein